MWATPPIWQVSSHRRELGHRHALRGGSDGTCVLKVACNPGQGVLGRTRKELPGPLVGTSRPIELSEKTHIAVAIQCVGFDCDGPGNEKGWKRWISG